MLTWKINNKCTQSHVVFILTYRLIRKILLHKQPQIKAAIQVNYLPFVEVIVISFLLYDVVTSADISNLI